MTIKQFFFAILFVVSSSFAEAANVEFVVSKMHSLQVFAETISGAPHRARSLREYFEKSKHNNKKNKKHIQRFEKAFQSVNYGWTFKGYPKERHMGQSVEKIFLTRSVHAKDLSDYSKRTLGILPPAEHKEYFEALGAIEPIFDAVIWKDNEKKIFEYREKISTLSIKWNIDDLFSKAAKFYNANWPKETPFIVALYPIPGERGHTSAESIYSLESVGVLVDASDFVGRFGVVFHEMCHSLYESQTAAFQRKFESFFFKNPSNDSALAYQYINEALATAIGNGWAYKKAAEKLDEGQWYNNKYINGFGKALYPMTSEYLEKNRTIDSAYVTKAISIFSKTFPNARESLDLVLNKIVLLSDGEAFNTSGFKKAIRKHFRTQSIHHSNPINEPESLNAAKSSKETLVVIATEKNIKQARSLTKRLPELEEEIKSLLNSKENIFHTGFLKDRRPYVLAKLKKKSDLPSLFKKLEEKKVIEPKKPGIF